MNLEVIILLKNILRFIVSLLLVFLLLQLEWKENAEALCRNGADFADRILKKSKLDYFNFYSIQNFLNTRGAVYLFGKLATPVTFLIAKILSGMLLLLLGLSLGSVLLSMIMGTCGFFFPDTLLTISNSADNDEMLNDMKCVYDTLRSQTKAGVYLSEALSECYLAVKNRRLKSALLELTNDINTRRDIEDALGHFNEKFDFGQIDIFCIVILQSLQSGRSVRVLEDLSLQMNDLQHAINVKEKEALERKIQIIELLIFAGLLAVTIYALGLQVYETLLF